jgi:hypothetical protein
MSKRAGRTVAVVCALASVLHAGSARGDTVRDGSEFVMDVRPDAHVCVLYPEGPLDPVACSGLKSIAAPPQPDARHNTLALAAVRLPEQGSSLVAVLNFGSTNLPNAALPTGATVGEFADAFAKSSIQDMPGTSVRGGHAAARLIEHGEVPLVRVSFDVDGLDAEHQNMEHLIAYTAWGSGAIYSVVFTCRAKNAAVVDALADESAASIRIAHPPKSRAYRMGFLIGSVLGVGFVAGGVVLAFVLIMRRGRGAGSSTSVGR